MSFDHLSDTMSSSKAWHRAVSSCHYGNTLKRMTHSFQIVLCQSGCALCDVLMCKPALQIMGDRSCHFGAFQGSPQVQQGTMAAETPAPASCC